MFQKKTLEKVEKVQTWRLEGIITCWPVGFKFMGVCHHFKCQVPDHRYAAAAA